MWLLLLQTFSSRVFVNENILTVRLSGKGEFDAVFPRPWRDSMVRTARGSWDDSERN